MSRRDRHRRRTRHRASPLSRVLLLTAVVATCGIAIGALGAVGWVVATADSAPNLSQLKPREPNPLSEVFASDGTLLGYIHSDRVFDYVAPDQLPERLKEATVAIEDRRFYQHGALDYQGILRAGIKDIFGQGNGLQGASTLTMQLVDNTYMPPTISANHNLKYKIVQAKLAEQLEKKHTKSWVLASYLNDVPYGTVGGETAIGVGAASEVFFNEPVQKIDLAQMALLAGLPQAPSEYNPFLAPGLAKVRRRQVLQAMVSSHYISQRLANEADRQPLQLQSNTQYSKRLQPYVFDYIEQQLIQKYGLRTVSNGGLKVYTTIDLHKQQEAQAAIDSHEGGPDLTAQPAAALVSVDPSNGHIVAMANSSTYNQTTFNYAAQAHRSSGSSFKVFALMTLIHDYNGDPDQTYYNSHYLAAGWLSSEPSWSVHTAEETYQGNINISKATIVSDNTVFAQLAVDLGMDKVDAMAHAMGITSPLDGNPAEVIGGLRIGVTPLEMADAYATVANGGSHVPATILSKVVFPDGSVQNLGDPPRTQVFSAGESAAAIKVLKGVIQSGTGTAADFGCPAGGKTGTSENLANAWFVGFTPQFSTAVWVGYPQGNVPMANGFGGSLSAPIWHDYMQAASNGFCGDFPQMSDSWSGTAFVGNHSTTGSPNVGLGNGSGGFNNGTGQYNNPTYYAAPPQGPPAKPGRGTTTTGGGGTGPPQGFGNGHNPGTGGGSPSGGSGTGGKKH